MKETRFDITGMGCAACSARIETVLNGKEGIKASVNLATNSAVVEYDENSYTDADIIKFVEQAGYGASVAADIPKAPVKKKRRWIL